MTDAKPKPSDRPIFSDEELRKVAFDPKSSLKEKALALAALGGRRRKGK